MSNMKSWKEVWDKRIKGVDSSEYTFSDLMYLDGYDISCSSTDESGIRKFVDGLCEQFDIGEGTKVLEIGCGAGLICYLLQERGSNVAGIDFSEPLINVAKSVMPDGDFIVDKANEFSFDRNDFDFVFSHSVFHYFESEEYGQSVLERMIKHTKPGGIVALTDIHDKNTMKEHLEWRKNSLGEEEYEQLYKHIQHQFYDPKEFIKLSEALCEKCWVGPQFLQTDSAKYKFNFYAQK